MGLVQTAISSKRREKRYYFSSASFNVNPETAVLLVYILKRGNINRLFYQKKIATGALFGEVFVPHINTQSESRTLLVFQTQFVIELRHL